MMIKNILKLSTLLLAFVLLFTMFTTMPTTVVFAGFTPTATPVPPTSTPIPPTATAAADSGSPAVEMTPTPIPTPSAIPSLGDGPGAGQMGVIGAAFLGIFLFLLVAWWRAWQLYQDK